MSVMLSFSVLVSSSRVYLLSDSLDDVCLEAVMIHYPLRMSY